MTNEILEAEDLTAGVPWAVDYLEVASASTTITVEVDSDVRGTVTSGAEVENVDLFLGLTDFNGNMANVTVLINREDALALADALFRTFANRRGYIVSDGEVFNMDDITEQAFDAFFD